MTAVKFYDSTLPLYNRLRAPLNAGTLETYAGGTITPLATYQDEALTILNATTLTTDADGYLPFDVWVSDAVAYRFVCFTSAAVPVFFEDQVLQVSFFVNTSGSITQLSGNPVLISSGSGSPEGVVTANISSIYLRINGTGDNAMYVKQSGSGNTGWEAVAGSDNPTFTTAVTAPTFIATGAANTQKEFTANSGASITINPSDGAYQTITLTANTTITLGSVPSSTTEREFILELVQDGTGGRTVAWSNITFANNGGALPPINTAIAGSTYIGISGTSTRWVGYPVNQGLGITNGSIPASGFVGYSTSSSVAIGSAVSLTTATAANVTSLTIGPGSFRLTGNIGFIPAAGTLPTILVGSINTTTATQATSPNGGAFVRQANTFPASESQVMPVGSMIVNPTVSTTYYLVATADFSVSTMTAYGSITAVEYI